MTQKKKKQIKDALDLILARDGIIDPNEVIREAESETSPLHDQFTWDDTEAAKQWRTAEARKLIRIFVTVIDGISEPIRYFVSLSSDRQDNGGYRSINAVMDSRQFRAIHLEDAKRELLAVQSKYAALTELNSIWKEVRKLFQSKERKIA